ncbi:MAG: TIGR00269 family protein [Nanoarchaeota archaeon]
MSLITPLFLNADDSDFVYAFEERVKNTIDQFQLLTNTKKILVAASGGKDSTTILYILKKLGYKITALTIDTHIGCYTEQNLTNITKFCEQYDIPLVAKDFYTEFGYSVCYLRDTLNQQGLNVKSCTVCGVPRRYLINLHTRNLNADVVVTGHNMDDECQAIMMNYLRNTLQLSARLGPRVGNHKDTRFVPRVKPLYFIRNTEVERYSKLMKFPVAYGHCPCSTDAYRRHIKDQLNTLEITHPNIKYNIINHFLSLLPMLKEMYTSHKQINACQHCGEPTSGITCKTCAIMIHTRNV